MLKLFNSFSSSKEEFIPFKKNLAKIFICGPTVYDYTHLGHARIFLTYDILARYLNDKEFLTDVLVNLTDINQNVFNKAQENSTTYNKIADFYASAFVDDLIKLNIQSVNRLVFVSDYVSNIEKYVKKLIEMKFAYVTHGNIYLDVSKVKNYGKISKQTQDQLSLHRLDIGPGKKNQEDIMLWNCTEDFEFSWKSDFGEGVPWWHIQDTAVALENFGIRYDIHGGARDLLYPHHEAHYAQFQLVTGSEIPVKTWMHIGLVLVDGDKMSKSQGNVVWIKDLVQKFDQNLIRLYLLSKHYHEDIDFTEKDLLMQKSLLDLIQLTKSKISDVTDDEIKNLIKNFLDALDDDLDTPLALEILEKLCSEVKMGKKINESDFNRICKIFGIKV